MIKVKLMGGLGNQMFQYALAKNLAQKNNTEVVLDLTFLNHRLPFTKYTFRKLELDIFNVAYKTSTLSKISKYFNNLSYIYQFVINKIKKVLFPNSYIKEKELYVFDNEVLKAKNNSYIDGYWQNERYFKEISDIIKKDFTSFKTPLSEKALKTKELINSTNSISVNFRRTDYVKNPEASAFYGVLGMDFYKEAIKIISERINNPHFFIFSDDIGWCKENFKIDFPTTFISKENSEGPIEDFRLMLECKNYIIPNSTFAWWAAWLNNTKEKIVIAPKKWIADPKINSEDFVPSEWIRI